MTPVGCGTQVEDLLGSLEFLSLMTSSRSGLLEFLRCDCSPVVVLFLSSTFPVSLSKKLLVGAVRIVATAMASGHIGFPPSSGHLMSGLEMVRTMSRDKFLEGDEEVVSL